MLAVRGGVVVGWFGRDVPAPLLARRTGAWAAPHCMCCHFRAWETSPHVAHVSVWPSSCCRYSSLRAQLPSMRALPALSVPASCGPRVPRFPRGVCPSNAMVLMARIAPTVGPRHECMACIVSYYLVYKDCYRGYSCAQATFLKRSRPPAAIHARLTFDKLGDTGCHAPASWLSRVFSHCYSALSLLVVGQAAR